MGAESIQGFDDPSVLDRAFVEHRILLTEDRDFGELALRMEIPTTGIVYVRFSNVKRGEAIEEFKKLWPAVEANVPGKFVVVSMNQIRIRSLRLKN